MKVTTSTSERTKSFKERFEHIDCFDEASGIHVTIEVPEIMRFNNENLSRMAVDFVKHLRSIELSETKETNT